ncbi:MAG: type IV toxin-antitoxin system AbiEi family antitoxin [Desulfobulbaceae bacterium]|nr:type IV toxin-antitoxin system AbiEi family antitoxin [Desulfobulbaceae bacterium]
MARKKIETEILAKATKRFEEETGLAVTWVTHNARDVIGTNQDVVVVIKAGKQLDKDVEYHVEVKKRVTRNILGTLAYTFKQTDQEKLLVTDYVNPAMAQELKKLEIQFIDTCGNAFIKHFPLYMFILGNKPDDRGKITVAGQRAFTKTGLKVVFALLCNPGLADKPIRDIADAAGVAVGTVDAVLTNLKGFKFLMDKGRRGRNLLHKNKLLERWVTGYQENLRTGLIIGKFTAANKYWWQETQLPEHNYWGGEVAAAKLTAYLQPEIITIYTHVNYQQVLLENQLKKDPRGEIEVLEAFWNENFYKGENNIVHPFIVYADLLASGDARNIETAKRVYEHEIAELVRED